MTGRNVKWTAKIAERHEQRGHDLCGWGAGNTSVVREILLFIVRSPFRMMDLTAN